MALKNYQTDASLNNLYSSILTNGLGESLTPRITSIGGTVTVYGAEKLPVGLTLANIATKMALVGDDVTIKSLESVPNFLAFVQKSGTVTELVVSCVAITSNGVIS